MSLRKRARILPALAGVLLLAAAAAPRPQAFDLSSGKLVDLTHAFDSQTLYWPTSPTTFALQKLSAGRTPGGWFYSANSFCAPEHGGTHLDAPYHFAEKGVTADRIPLRQLIAPAVVIDARKQAASDPDYRLTAGDLSAWESAHGRVPSGAIVLLRTGWSARWPDRRRYLGDYRAGDASNLHFP
ncbi:MAG: cyclase family protein, partial [Thermoanaerobaculia bacterium]